MMKGKKNKEEKRRIKGKKRENNNKEKNQTKSYALYRKAEKRYISHQAVQYVGKKIYFFENIFIILYIITRD